MDLNFNHNLLYFCTIKKTHYEIQRHSQLPSNKEVLG